ncbi:MAG: hypothetical protein MHM6MM_003442 [Cercozoa sp. M6MM]
MGVLSYVVRVGECIGTYGVLALGPVLVIAAQVLIWTIAYVYFVDLHDGMLQHYGKTVLLMLYLPAAWATFNMLFNHVMCVLTPAGESPAASEYSRDDDTQETNNLLDDQENDDQENVAINIPPHQAGKDPSDLDFGNTNPSLVQLRADPCRDDGFGGVRHCHKCQKPKPWRSHHCSICGKCVLRMDHHCPWMGRCVGYRNHGYFLLFLIYLWLGCALFAATTMPVLLRSKHDTTWRWRNLLDPPSHVTALQHFALTMCFTIGVVMLMFAGWHCYLAARNLTTIDYMIQSDPEFVWRERALGFVNPFDLGVRENWAQLFRTRSLWKWLLPRVHRFQPGAGLVFPVRAEVTEYQRHQRHEALDYLEDRLSEIDASDVPV